MQVPRVTAPTEADGVRDAKQKQVSKPQNAYPHSMCLFTNKDVISV